MKYVLANDGGGMRSVMTAYILSVIEKEVGFPLHKCFDLVVGTSGGSIVSAGIASGYSGDDLVKIMFDEGKHIFARNLATRVESAGGFIGGKYESSNLEGVLRNYYGVDGMKHLHVPMLVTTYNWTDGKPKMFKSRVDQDVPTYKAVAASAAAPTYFDPIWINGKQYVDGGVVASNPALIAFAEIKTMFQVEAKDITLCSFGTGNRQKGNPDPKFWLKYKWVKPLIDTMMAGGGEVTDYILNEIYTSTKHRENYYRITGKLPDNVDEEMANASRKNLQALVDFGKILVDVYHEEISQIVNKLRNAALQK